MNLLFLSVPAFPYQASSPVSVIERLTLEVAGLAARGHRCSVLAPHGSDRMPGVIELDGRLHPNADVSERQAFLLSPDSVLMNMLEYARLHQSAFDAMVSVGQDYMTLWAQPYFSRAPLLVIPSTPYGIPECDALLRRRYLENPQLIGFLTQAHRRAFLRHAGLPESGLEPDVPVLWEPFDPGQYPVEGVEKDDRTIFWAGRITPDKGVLEVARAVRRLGRRLQFAGVVNDPSYLQAVIAAGGTYLGVLDRAALSRKLASSPVFFQFQSPAWSEAFGRTTAEALLCGTPVIAFDNGANAEVIEAGLDGFIVRDLDEAIARFDDARALDAVAIRQRAASRFDRDVHVGRLESWLDRMVDHARCNAQPMQAIAPTRLKQVRAH